MDFLEFLMLVFLSDYFASKQERDRYHREVDNRYSYEEDEDD